MSGPIPGRTPGQRATRISASQIADWLGPGDRLAMLGGAAFGFGVAGLRLGWLAALPFAPLGAATVAVVVIDRRHYRIPDLICLPLGLLGLLHAGAEAAPARVLAMAAIWAGLRLLQFLFLRLRGRAGLGGGDVKLISAAAAWLPVALIPGYILAAALTALIEALILRADRNRRLAFGAHLAPWLLVFALVG